ncbi:hypothetical protein [Streptomyces cinereoruber]|uniref:hypothetical protein n=1 Tax=Streptomyces cinereoruber TaxID=67260 RepID=UPI0036416E89
MNDYPPIHRPGHMAPAPRHGSRPVPPLDDELDGQLEDCTGIHPGVDMILDGIRLLAIDRLSADKTQTILSTLAGADSNILNLIGRLAQRLTHPDTNPALNHLDPETTKTVQLLGERFAYDLAVLAPGEFTAEAAALIDGA